MMRLPPRRPPGSAAKSPCVGGRVSETQPLSLLASAAESPCVSRQKRQGSVEDMIGGDVQFLRPPSFPGE